ncbi:MULTISPECIES: non-ribosomal peptide synthetase [Pseudomonas]|uniref:non-ribosomal peptide synthetase n=1 Tax=Pseudomonas TaxID=286 RepID=UPI001BE70329|nr:MULTISPECIES: non-ribosomal peptide synthetase [Pseudomonas]MBT2340709.1 non-ribosomal peptide synthetase [Pseudomonas fluorescens]MCD4528849.1 non-ribosomal peptide synthetase [Pseudomonas sp. C3-2018]
MLFTERFLEQVARYSHLPAISDEVSDVSYEELYLRARRAARYIAKAGSEIMVGVGVSKSVDYIVAILAVHLLGRTVVPLDCHYPISRLKQMITSVDLSLCLISSQQKSELTDMLHTYTRVMYIEDVTGTESANDDVGLEVPIEGESPAYVVFTSGTTGKPKPILMPYRALSTLIDWMGKAPEPSGTTLLYAAQGFDVSFQEIYATLCYGDRLLIITEAQKKDLQELTQQLSNGKVTRLFLPTSMLIPFMTFNLQEGRALSDLREVIVAGEQLKVTPIVRKWFKAHPFCRFINHYGPSETHVVMACQLDNEPDGWPDLPPIGQLIAGNEAWLLDERLQPVKPGSAGQLYISGSSLALGYYGMPEQTSKSFTVHPVTQKRMYGTGDICVLNERAQYEYKGRHDRQYKVRGYRVELKEIEVAAMASGLVDDCLIVASKLGLTTSLTLYFTTQKRVQDLSLSLHTHLAAALPEYMLPSFYRKISAIPLNQNGKVDIAKLPPVGGITSQLSSNYVEPQGQLETLVCALTAECIGLDRIGVNDNFMEAGANSFTLISMLAELRHVLGHRFRQTDFFEYPTPRLLCENAQRLKEAPESKKSIVADTKRKLRSAAIQYSGTKKGLI